MDFIIVFTIAFFGSLIFNALKKNEKAFKKAFFFGLKAGFCILVIDLFLIVIGVL